MRAAGRELDGCRPAEPGPPACDQDHLPVEHVVGEDAGAHGRPDPILPRVSTAAEPRPAELPLPGGSEGATVKLHPLLSGSAKAPPGWFEREDGRLARLHALGIGVSKDDFVEVPFVSFLVEHPSARAILIDIGLHPSIAV